MTWWRVSKPLPPPDIIQQCIGAFGRWHCWLVLWAIACRFANAWHLMSIILQAPKANFTCADTNVSDPCSRNCTEHVFDRSVFTETITTQWDLVCDKFQYNNVVQVVGMSGILVGGLIFGALSDRYGRKVPFIVSVMVQALSGCLAAVVPWYWAHVTFRFFCTAATGGAIIINFVLIMEFVGLKWRATMAILAQIPFILGHATLPLIAYYVRDWRWAQFIMSVMSFALFVYYWIIPESPRWLLAVGKTTQAIGVLERCARHNKLPTEHIKTDIADYVQHHTPPSKTGVNVFSLFRTPSLRVKTCCLSFNWLVCGLCYYGVAQLIGELGGNIFVNVALSAVTQLPGTLITIVATEKMGRRATLMASNTLSGACILLIGVIPKHLPWLHPLLGSMGMLGISISFPTIYIYTAELFPTVLRNVGCGLTSVCSRLGAIVAPFAAKTADTPSWPSLVLFGVIPIIGACLCVFLPETVNCKLPDTVEEAEVFGKKIKKRDDAVQETSTGQNVQ